MQETPKVSGAARFAARFKEYLPEDKRWFLKKAYQLSKDAHRPVTRKDGLTRYFEHCRGACEIAIGELGIKDNWRLLVAILMHDGPEDTWLIDFRLIERVFDKTVRLWVEYVTKTEVNKDTYVRDILNCGIPEVLIIKLCDRLHNLRTLGTTPEKFQVRQALETRDEYLVIAEKLIEILPADLRWRGVYLRDNIEAVCKSYETEFGI
ncbi:bifunctional (p)ppGpp synthetase/guanosine-3',5'-bis(diphosphate) 3'-pyrophosphohydrolase [Candidatus Parcubacteria bacterium]|jgi:GTP diphosphokinase / guanosine-3',5'-bis(diphosphate) 3'-diphosphatase|nr:bifunctional (p)ppGpp synthetase/guanosine-3',5'-bis(diphosphate) 3'-pyrophosphohydrolase [Candidatus Parcubacteria bacterium]